MQPKEKIIMFDTSKGENYNIWNNFKLLCNYLDEIWIVTRNTHISIKNINEANVFILPAPVDSFTCSEFNKMKKYIKNGGRILVLMGESNENKHISNINFFLEEYGIMINNGIVTDCVMRSSYYKYFHPKECLISDGVLMETLRKCFQKDFSGLYNKSHFEFLYPFGVTLNVTSPSIPVLTTGTAALPSHRCICAFYIDECSGGRLAVLGSVDFMSDAYLNKEQNAKIIDLIFTYLTSEEKRFDKSVVNDIEISDYSYDINIAFLSGRAQTCLQISELLRNENHFNEKKLFSLNMNLLPKVLSTYEKLHIPYEQLSIIKPQFEISLPPLEPAIFSPFLLGVSNPPLELYDLEDAVCSTQTNLTQIANQCSDDDIEFYINAASDILGITEKLSTNNATARHVLDFIWNFLRNEKLSY